MPPVAPPAPAVAPIATAGLLLAAVSFLQKLGLPCPSTQAVLDATGATKSRAYEVRAAVLDGLPSLVSPPGRPASPPAAPVDTGVVSRSILAFLMDHPGAVTGGPARRRYSDAFRHRVVELAEQHPDLDRAQLALAVNVPGATLDDWLDASARVSTAPSRGHAEGSDPTEPHLASVLDAWRRWEGGFAPFCAFVRTGLLLPFGTTLVRRILAVHAGRRPRRRAGRSPDEVALRKQLVAFFPGAQWFADGSQLALVVNGRRYRFNWELVVDGATGALVGAAVSDEEDGAAVAGAFADAVATAGAPPLALTTDNRTANLAPEVERALGDTVHVPITPGRPQNDAPIEGAFGLFAQTAPPLVVTGDTPRARARSILQLVLTTWARATNHRPRNDRRGRTRVQHYRDEQPTTEQIAAARAALEERRRRQVRADRTRKARLDPVVRAMLDNAFARLRLADPTGNARDAIARYPHDAVLAGLATFEGKRAASTLPPDAGARYLLGIVRNVAERDENLAIADALWHARLQAGDRALVALEAQRAEATGSPADRVRAFVDHALAAHGPVVCSFWLRAAAQVIGAAPVDHQKTLYDSVVRRIATTFRVDHRARQAAVRYLAAQVLPVA